MDRSREPSPASDPREIDAAFRRASEIIGERGWTSSFTFDDGPVNIRQALVAACKEVDEKRWYTLYIAATTMIRYHLKDGICSWEFGTHANSPRRRTAAEVEKMLAELIGKLDGDPARHGSDSRIV